MPCKPNTACADCAKPMFSRATTGTVRCRPCRAAHIRHGTTRGYKKGCRCAGCKAAHADAMREYTKRRTERDGLSQYAQYFIQKAAAEGREYIPESRRTFPCAVCGRETIKRNMESPVPAMHRACKDTAEGYKITSRATPGYVPPRLKAFKRKMEKAAMGRPATNRTFIQGACAWCEQQFCSPGGRYCSTPCANKYRKAQRYPEKFNPSPALRREVYTRDQWTCQLCLHPIDKALRWPHKWSPSLDHIIPQSHQVVPDHTANNLRAVHLQCNSMRGDGSNMSEDELRDRATKALASV